MDSVPSDIIYFSMITCCSLSILGSIFIIFYITKSDFQAFYSKIVLFISLSDIVRSILFMVDCNKFNNIYLTAFIAVLMNSSILITIIWSTYISITLYLAIVKSKTNFDQNYDYWFFLSFIMTPALNILPISTNSFGVSDTTCTLKSDYVSEIWRLILIYIPAWIFIIISLIACSYVYCEIRAVEINTVQEKLVKKLIFYPIILIIEFLPMTIVKVLSMLNILSADSMIGMTTMNIYLLHGASNLIVYAVNLEKERYKRSSLIQGSHRITAEVDSNDFDGKNLLFNTFSILEGEQSSN